MVISKLKIGTYLGIFAAGFILSYFLFKDQSTTVKTKPITGKFEPAIPISQKPVGEPLVVTWKTDTKYIKIKTQGQVNDSLLSIYRDSIGSLESELEREKQRAQMYLDAITFREFKHTFEDSNLKVTFNGTVQGHLKSVEVPEYQIKPIEVEVPVKRFGLSLYAGYGLSNDLTLAPQVGIGLSYSIWEF